MTPEIYTSYSVCSAVSMEYYFKNLKIKLFNSNIP